MAEQARLQISISPEQAKAGAAAVKRAIDELKQSAQGLRGELLDTFSARTLAVGGMIAGATAITAALASVTRTALDYARSVDLVTRSTSLSAREASAWAYAAGQNGVSMRELQSGMERLNQRMTDVRNGTGEGERLFQALGVSAVDASGQVRGTTDVFLDVVEALGRFRDDGAKSTMVSKLLGDSLQEMAHSSREAIEEQVREAQRLGLVLGDEDVRAARDLDRSMDQLEKRFLGLSVSVGKELIPTLTESVDLFSHFGGGAVSGALGFVHDRLVGLNVLLRELQANSRFLFGTGQDTLSLEGLRQQIHDIEAEGQRRRLLFEHPTALEFIPSPPPPRDTRPGLPAFGAGADRDRGPFDAHVTQYYDREREQLDLLFRGAASLRTEVEEEVERLLEDLKRDNQRTIDQITKDFAGDTPEERQHAEGIRIRDRSIMEYRERLREQDLNDARLYYQGEMDMAKAQFANDEVIAQKQRALLRAELAFKLGISSDSANRLMFLYKYSGDPDAIDSILQGGDQTLSMRAKEAITKSAVANDIPLAERANGDFLSGWTRGLQDYVSRTENAFNLSNDMARRTAQAMEQSFQRFFFDGMEGRFKSFQDVLQGVLDFTKQITSQIAAQMVTMGIVKPGASALGSLFGASTFDISQYSEPAGPISPIYQNRFGGIMPVERFAAGGIARRPQLAMFGEGAQSEAFVPLPDGERIPVTMRYAGNLPMPVGGSAHGPTIQNNVKIEVQNQSSAEVQVGQPRQQIDGTTVYQIVIKNVKKGLEKGDLDLGMGRYGMKPGGFKR